MGLGNGKLDQCSRLKRLQWPLHVVRSQPNLDCFGYLKPDWFVGVVEHGESGDDYCGDAGC